MIAKYILPWFGGTPTAWTTCLLLFQMLLLAGYTYAHFIDGRLRPRTQAMIHLTLLMACLGVMAIRAWLWNSPVLPGAEWKNVTVEFPILQVLVVVSASVGLPYFALSPTAPLLQSWFARKHPDASPYRLYAISNFGSLLALLTYPFLLEPNLSLTTQARLWSWLFFAFSIGLVFCALPLRTAEAATPLRDDAASDRTSLGTKTLWLALSACAAALLYGATGQLTQNIAPIPFLWILPLALYLLSFIICFDSDRWYHRGIFHPLLGGMVIVSLLLTIYTDQVAAIAGRFVLSELTLTLLLEVASAALLMFAGCMVCHGELVRLKPHWRNLTVFYLIVSAGGALGGLLSVVVAPLLFSGFWDFRVAVWASALLMIICLIRDKKSWVYTRRPAVGVAIFAAALAFPLLLRIVAPIGAYLAIAFVVVAGAARITRKKYPPRWVMRFGGVTQVSMLAAAAVLGGIYLRTIALSMHDSLWMTRNFYGIFRVVEDRAPDNTWLSYQLMNGRIAHGKQFFSSAYRQLRHYPAAYYGVNGGLGLLLTNHPKRLGSGDSPLRVGVVGLGVGAIAAWGKPGDYFRFYEINPAVISVASDPAGFFTYLHDSAAKVEIVPGDARLSLEREQAEGYPQQFDILVIDAFSGDTVPAHLLTREAMQVYLRALKPDGVLAVHISNLYLDLRPVLAEHSRSLNLHYGYVHADEKDMTNWASDWVLLSRSDAVLNEPAIASHLEPIDQSRRVRPWTDDYSNLFQLLK